MDRSDCVWLVRRSRWCDCSSLRGMCTVRGTIRECGVCYHTWYPSQPRASSHAGRLLNVLHTSRSLSRSVCEQLLCHLDLSNLLFWSEALRVVKEIVGGVDYKVCNRRSV